MVGLVKRPCEFIATHLDLAFGGSTLWPAKSRGRASLSPKVWTWPLEGLYYGYPIQEVVGVLAKDLDLAFRRFILWST